MEQREGARDREQQQRQQGLVSCVLKLFLFSELMNILQGLKLRWDLSICGGKSKRKGLCGDTATVATVVCLEVMRSQARKANHTSSGYYFFNGLIPFHSITFHCYAFH